MFPAVGDLMDQFPPAMNHDLNASECSRLIGKLVRRVDHDMESWSHTCWAFSALRRVYKLGFMSLRNTTFQNWILEIFIILLFVSSGFCGKSDLPVFKTCNSKIYLEPRNLHQGELQLVIRDSENSAYRVSCDFTINAGSGKHIMFYFTDVFLGSPNKTERRDRACIEPRDVTTHFEGIPESMRALICSRTEVELAPRVYYTKGHALSIRFYRNMGYAITAYFKLVFTAFRTGSCRTSERRCKNDRCIAHDLVCNDRNPCGDYSDCPTGLEHLSSFAMCGIVILGLLSGGIIIIMAAVCLQRSSSKNLDLDDFSSVNGLRPPDNNLEMTDVNKKRLPSHSMTDPKEGLAHEKFHSNPENIPFCNSVTHNPNDNACTSDKERLIKNGRTLHEAYLESYRKSGSDVNLLKHNKTSSGNSDDTVTTNASSFDVDEDLDIFHSEQTTALMPEMPPAVSHSLCKGNQEDARYSGNGLILTDSDSGNEMDHRTRENNHLPRKNFVVKEKPSNSLYRHTHSNGKTSQPSNHVFTDFKPSAPQYGYTLSPKNTFDVPITSVPLSPQKPYTMNVK